MPAYPLVHQPISPGMQLINPMNPTGFNPGIPYQMMPMNPPIAINYPQQPPPPPPLPISPLNSTLSHNAQPFQPQQQTTSAQSVDRQTLQFVPGQVLRNMPK